ncbi:protein rep [Corynebacterium sp. AOP40-4SA-5]|uniref:protein rep n=1 Tax=Corynebacterium sp. AOP40-4SA-5 TaxID=3457678 RepID=UPI004034160A
MADVPVRWKKGEKAGLAGLQTCGSVWTCPVCAAKIAAHRSDEVGGALKTHLDQGKAVLFVTLTVRHTAAQPLPEVWGVVSKAWAAVHRTGAWRGTKKTIGEQERYGVRGWIRSVETTHGKNGWHVHTHAAVLLDQELTDEQRDTFAGRIYSRWSAACERAGFVAPTRERGVDVRQIVSGEGAAQAVGRYLVKSGLKMELTGGHRKKAKGQNRSPFEILVDIHDAREQGREYADDLRLWHTWEAGSHGRRQLSWSRGLREELALEAEQTDEEIAAAELDGFVVGVIAEEDWRRARRDVEMRIDLLRAVERCKSPEAAADAVRMVLTFHEYTYADCPPIPITPPPPRAVEERRVGQQAIWDKQRQAREKAREAARPLTLF